MRTIEEMLNDKDFSRTYTTYEEEVIWVNYWYDEYERTGFCETFMSPYEQYKKYNGQSFEVLKRVPVDIDDIDNFGFDLECLPVWKIRFADGFETFAFPEEICLIERK